MKLLCPNCNKKVDIQGESRYEIFRCTSCNYEFRGLHAPEELLDYMTYKYLGRPLNIVAHCLTLGIVPYENNPDFGLTPCLHCDTPIRVRAAPNDGGIIAPDCCPYCCNWLPTDRISRFYNRNQEQKPEVQAEVVAQKPKLQKPPKPPKPTFEHFKDFPKLNRTKPSTLKFAEWYDKKLFEKQLKESDIPELLRFVRANKEQLEWIHKIFPFTEEQLTVIRKNKNLEKLGL